MPRTALVLVTSVALLAGAAAAQDAGTGVTSLASALDLRGGVHATFDHGCSRSYEHLDRTAELHLTIGPRGHAQLEVDARTLDVFGSSPLSEERREPTRTHYLARAELRGRVESATADSLRVRFTSGDAASVTFEGWGSLPLPGLTATPVDATLRCDRTSTPVLPERANGDEAAVATMLATCTLDGAPQAVTEVLAEGLVFGRGAGVTLEASTGGWSADRGRRVRLRPAR